MGIEEKDQGGDEVEGMFKYPLKPNNYFSYKCLVLSGIPWNISLF